MRRRTRRTRRRKKTRRRKEGNGSNRRVAWRWRGSELKRYVTPTFPATKKFSAVRPPTRGFSTSTDEK